MADDLQRIIRLDVNATQALQELAKLRGATDAINKQMGGMSTQMNAAVARIQNVAGVLTSAFAAFKGLQAVTEAGDKIRNLTGSFEALLGSADRASGMMGEVFAVVSATGADMDSVANSMQRLSVALADAGGTNEQIAQIAENFIKLGRIGGSSMEDATGALVQFTQGLASGKLAGDELKSIMERVPLVGKEIAKELGVGVGQLKEMGAAGKITADVAFKALLNGTERIAEQFAKMPLTMGQAFNQMAAVGTQMLAQFDEVSGISTTVAIAFGAITDMLAEINGGLGDASDETSAWADLAKVVGNAFKGVLIVVNTIVGAVRAVVFGVGATGDIAAKLLNPLQWKNVGKTASDTAKSLNQIVESTFATNKALALGEQTTKAATRAQRDYKKQMDEVAKTLEANNTANAKAKKAGAAKPPKDSEWDKWIKSLEASTAALELLPKQLDHVNKELDAMAEAGDTTSARFVTLTKVSVEMTAALNPVAAALQKINDTIKEQDNAQAVMEGVAARMEVLAKSGGVLTREMVALGEAYAKMKAEQDPTGAERLVQDLIKAEAEMGNLQAKFDAINAALEAGTIKNEAAAQKLKDSLVGADSAAKKVAETTKTLSQAIAEAGAKFVTDFSDKVIDSLGDIDASFGDMVESMLKQLAKLMLNNYFQQFVKMLEGAQGQGGWIGAFAALVTAAKGAAFDAHGAQFFANGGVVTKPTMFAHGGGLGVMGERGAEAIVPLQRSASGDLGVGASPVQVNVYNNADVEVTETHRDNADGSRIVDITIERKVRAMFASGQMDRTMRGAYGVTRQPTIG